MNAAGVACVFAFISILRIWPCTHPLPSAVVHVAVHSRAAHLRLHPIGSVIARVRLQQTIFEIFRR